MLTDATSNVILCQPTKSFDRPIEGMLMGDKAVNRRSFSTQRFLFHLKKSIQCPLVCLLCKLIYSLHPTILLSVVSQVLIVRCSHLERFNNCFKCEIVVNKTKGPAKLNIPSKLWLKSNNNDNIFRVDLIYKRSII